MKLKALVAVVVLAAAVGSAGAQQQQTTMLIAPDTDGCQLIAPYSWIELDPGQKWTQTIDLSGCQASDLGWFRYYGHLGTNSSCDPLRTKDGVVLKAMDIRTQAVYQHTAVSGPKAEEFVLMQVTGPTQFQVSAENTSRQRVKVRMTWAALPK